MLDRMQTRTELYRTIGYADYQALHQSIVRTIVPEGMTERLPRFSEIAVLRMGIQASGPPLSDWRVASPNAVAATK
jgi:hypothetical protein